jgi:hypothetical protein
MVKLRMKLMSCQDCLFYAANGDLPEGNRGLEKDILLNIGATATNYLCVGDSNKDDEFSSLPCECCRSPLGGSRHELVVVY